MIDMPVKKLSLSGSLLLNGNFVYMWCATHVLNLIVKEGLDIIGIEIEKIHESVAYWLAIPLSVKEFEDVARQLCILCNKKLSLDCKTQCVGLPHMWGSGPHMLGDQVGWIGKDKKRQKGDKEKGARKKRLGKTQRREKREKRISLPKFHQQADPASFIVRLSWNLEERFETQVATIWTVEIRFWDQEIMLLPMNSNDIFGILSPIFFVFDKRDCIIQDYMCSWCIWQPLEIILEKTSVTLLIVEVWTGLGPVVFLFALGGFPHKKFWCLIYFLLDEFNYFLLLIDIAYLVLHKERVEKLWCL